MNCNDIHIMIYEYLDNELTQEKEGVLFTHISTCLSCRQEFKVQSKIQNEVALHMKKVPAKLEERIFESIENRSAATQIIRHTRSVPVYLNFALGIIIIAFALFSFFQISSLKNDVNTFREGYQIAMERMQYQTQQMSLYMNNMPAVQVTSQPVQY